MSNLTVRFNGEEIKEVVGISYLEGISKLRVVTNLDNKLVSDDYDTGSIVIDVIGSKVDYKVPVPCVYQQSDTEFIGVVGRYSCISIDDAGHVRIVDKDLHWIVLKIERAEVDKVRKIAGDGLGSIYVEVNNGGLGKIYNRAIEDDVE